MGEGKEGLWGKGESLEDAEMRMERGGRPSKEDERYFESGVLV
jgi:hypothetical protein